MNIELLTLLSAAIPKDELLKSLRDAINEYLLVSTEENESDVHFYTQLYMLNQLSKGTIEGASELNDRFKSQIKRNELFNLDKN